MCHYPENGIPGVSFVRERYTGTPPQKVNDTVDGAAVPKTFLIDGAQRDKNQGVYQ